MYITIKEFHNILGMIVLFSLILVILFILISLLRKKSFLKANKIIALIGLILVHLQISFGFVLYFLSPLGLSNLSRDAVSHHISRFYFLEHPVGMTLAAVLITLGYRSIKREDLTDSNKYKRMLIYYILGFIIISYLIPWFLWN